MKLLAFGLLAFIAGASISIHSFTDTESKAAQRTNISAPPLIDMAITGRAKSAANKEVDNIPSFDFQPNQLAVAESNVWRRFIEDQNWSDLLIQSASLSDASVQFLELELALLVAGLDHQLAFLKHALTQAQPDEAIRTLMRALVSSITKKDPIFAYTFFIGLTAEQKAQIADSFITTYAQQKPLLAWQLLDDYQDAGHDYLGRRGTRAFRSQVLSTLAKEDSSREQAFELLFSLHNGRDVKRLNRYLGNVLGQTNIQAALDYRFPAEFEDLRRDFINAAIGSHANLDALDSAERLLAYQQLATANSVRSVARNLMRLEDPYHLEDFYNQIDDEALKDNIELEAARHAALQKDDASAQDWIARIDDQRLKYRAVQNAINALGYEDYSITEHLQLISQVSFTDGNMRNRAITTSLANWHRVQPDKVRSYVQSMPESELRARLSRRFQLNEEQS